MPLFWGLINALKLQSGKFIYVKYSFLALNLLALNFGMICIF